MRSKEQIENLFANGKHFCVLPWAHLHVTTLGYMSPCSLQFAESNSKGYGSLNENSFYELWQGEAIRNFRLKKIADEMDERCAICYENEKINNYSNRILFNSFMIKTPVMDWVVNTDSTGYAPEAAPIFWDVRFSNLCNLRCRSCDSENSSSWYEDDKSLYNLDCNGTGKAIKGINDSNALLRDLEPYLPYVRNFYFAGGEPLLYPENLTILEKLDSLKQYDIPLIYNTNFTRLNKNSRFLKLWKKFNNISIWISLDGSYKRGEYLRKGSVWDDIVNNLDNLKKECPQADIVIKFTVSAFNILHLPDFHKEMVERYLRADKINFNIVQKPDFYSTRILPKELKEKAAKKIEDHLTWLMQQDPFHQANDKEIFEDFADQWHKCINFMNSADFTYLIPKFQEYTNKIDNLRNEKCLDVFPELEPLFR